MDVRVARACDQLDRYVADKHLYGSPLLRGTTLSLLYLVFQGHSLIDSGLHK